MRLTTRTEMSLAGALAPEDPEFLFLFAGTPERILDSFRINSYV